MARDVLHALPSPRPTNVLSRSVRSRRRTPGVFTGGEMHATNTSGRSTHTCISPRVNTPGVRLWRPSAIVRISTNHASRTRCPFVPRATSCMRNESRDLPIGVRRYLTVWTTRVLAIPGVPRGLPVTTTIFCPGEAMFFSRANFSARSRTSLVCSCRSAWTDSMP